MEQIMTRPEVTQRKKIHPHKFAMWLAISSIIMMFAGLTSAYIVRLAQGRNRIYHLPGIFWVSTIVIVTSSITIMLGLRAFRQRRIPLYRTLMTVTLLLGVAFAVCQSIGFYQLYHVPQALHITGDPTLTGMTPVTVAGNPSESFLFIITGLHMVHVIGGIIALLIVFLLAYRKRIKVYNATGLEIVATYWHFVDVLWIYLFIIFLSNTAK